MFQKATKSQAFARLALEGPAGFGKTYTGLVVATGLAGRLGKRVAALDTEAGSMSKYAHLFDFDVVEVGPPFHPDRVAEAIREAVAADYGAFLVDSLSHFWTGEGGLLEIVDTIGRQKYRGDNHRAWKDAGEIQQRLTDSILRSPIHVVAAMRTKKDFVRETVEKDGREQTRIRYAGTKTIQRDEFDYEFDLIGRFDSPALMAITKSRVDTLPPETVVEKPGAEFVETFAAWLADGESTDPTEEQRKRLADALKAGKKVDKDRFTEAAVERVAGAMFGRPVEKLRRDEFERVVAKIEKVAAEALAVKAEADAAAKADAPS